MTEGFSIIDDSKTRKFEKLLSLEKMLLTTFRDMHAILLLQHQPFNCKYLLKFEKNSKVQKQIKTVITCNFIDVTYDKLMVFVHCNIHCMYMQFYSTVKPRLNMC